MHAFAALRVVGSFDKNINPYVQIADEYISCILQCPHKVAL